jgi:hypothetical protein
MRIMVECSTLPLGARWFIRNSLKWIPEIDQAGIECIYLRDKLPQSTLQSPKWHTSREKEGLVTGAVYAVKTSISPPHIVLFIKDLYYAIPSIVRFSPMTGLYIAQHVAHEVGHHLIEERGYVFVPSEKYPSDKYEEEMANRYAFEILNKMKKRWYYKLGDRLMKHISAVYFGLGSGHWKKKEYAKSVAYWYKSWLLDPENQRTAEWYWRAKNMRDQ